MFLGLSLLTGAWFGLAGVVAVACFTILALAIDLTRVSVAALIVLAAVLGLVRIDAEESPSPDISLESSTVVIEGTVSGHPLSTANGQRFEFLANDPDLRLCALSPELPPLESGMTINASAEITPVQDTSSNTRGFLESSGCAASANLTNIEIVGRPPRLLAMLVDIRNRIALTFQRAAPGDSGALMTGLVTGDDSGLSFRARQEFLDTGTTHITAVSGANFALVLMLAVLVAGSRANRKRWDWLLATAAAIWGYALLVGMAPSAFRAAILATLVLLAYRTGRRPDLLTLSVVGGAIQILLRPSDLHSVAFQLSFVTTIALVLVFSGMSRTFNSIFAAAFVSAVVAHLATIPILLTTFGEVSTAAIPANVAIAPIVFIAFPLSAIAGAVGVVSPTIGEAVAIPASLFSEIILEVTSTFAQWTPGRIAVSEPPLSTVAIVTGLCWIAILAISQEPRAIATHMAAWSKQQTLESLVPAIGFGMGAGMVIAIVAAFR